jgi:hypothetical protein
MMPHWLVYNRCPDCMEKSCLQCRRPERQLTLGIIKTEDYEAPLNALNGPFETAKKALELISEFFEVDEATGLIHFKVK